ncbi:MAG: type IV pili methyl-accepting chemotaxis transducer N-terminal domain-containing protein [Pseudomonadota bacterium]
MTKFHPIRMLAITAFAFSFTTAAFFAPLTVSTAARADGLFAVGSTGDDRRKANLVSRQKMLVERMAANACLITRGIDVEADKERLTEAHDIFLATQAALREGNDTIGLAAEKNERVLQQLAAVERSFRPFDLAALSIADGTAEVGTMTDMMRHTTPLYNALDKLAGLVDRVYVKRQFSVGALAALDYAGKQRWLSQKMVREACLVGDAGQEHVPLDLGNTLVTFESRLKALRDGERLIGLPPAEDPELLDTFDEAEEIWEEIRPVLIDAADGTAPDPDALHLLAKDMTPLLAALNDAVYLIEGRE